MNETKSLGFTEEPERCVLVGLVQRNQSKWEVEDHIDELRALALTSGAEIAQHFVQERPAPDPAFFIGKGKIDEIARFAEANAIDMAIFDDELSPGQIRNITKALNIKVIDRTSLILDIFAQHARTSEAKVQVELAQLNYMLPRLTRQWQHLSRQAGGVGTRGPVGSRGPGETQLETDRRLVRSRIAVLKKALEKISRQNETQRQPRNTSFRAALIGYTNAGKSTLMNTLTHAGVLVEDKLFATLDTTVRRLTVNPGMEILLSDTVGFIRKLPHHLVASFRTTLTEAMEADLLLHVADVTHPHVELQLEVVHQILGELNILDTNRLLIFNKVDALKSDGLLEQLRASYPEALFISANRHIGLHALLQRLQEISESQYETRRLKLNYLAGAAEHLLYPLATILEKQEDDHYLCLTVKYDIKNKAKILAIAEQYK
jgi:GTP-binding protein HflX